jgi:O-antigen/teichoic acid export membrane protein
MVASTAINTGLGMVFWIVAARRFPAAEIGVASAAVSAMSLLLSVGQLGLPLSLPRLLPAAGPGARRLLGRAFAAAVTASTIVGFAFVVVGRRTPGLEGLLDNSAFTVWFVLSVPFCVIFAVQDFVLCALRRAVWTPTENLLYSAGRFALLVPLGGAGAAGLYLAWTVPAAVAAIVVSAAVFRWVLPPGEVASGAGVPGWLTGAALVRLVSSDYVGGMAQQAAVRGLPLVVLAAAGSELSAYFYVAWTAVLALDTVLSNVVTAVTVEGATSEDRMRAHVRGLLKRGAAPTLACVAAAWITAPWALAVFGPGYDEATWCLRILAVGIVPRAVLLVASAVARHERRPARILTLQVAPAVLTVSGALLAGTALEDVAVGFVGAQLMVAVPAALWLAGWLRGDGHEQEVT